MTTAGAADHGGGLDEIMKAVAAHHLPGAIRIHELLDADPAPFDSIQMVRRAEGEKLLGSLQAAAVAGEIELSEEASDLLAQRHQATMAWCLKLEVRLLELQQWFRDAGGVRYLVIKGPAIAHLDELEPSMRSFADVDLLVEARDLDRAVAVLDRHDASRPWPQLRDGFDRRFAKSVTMTCEDGIEIDLHRTLCDGVHGVRIPLAELFDHAEEFYLGGERLGALSAPHRLMHSAYHAILGSPAPRLYSLRDIAGYLTSPHLTPTVVVPVAQRWRGEAVLASAVRTTLDTFTFTAPLWEEWLNEVRISQREALLVARQRSEGSSIGRAKLDMWRELPGIRLRASYLRALLLPSSEHLEARGLTRRRAVRRSRGA